MDANERYSERIPTYRANGETAVNERVAELAVAKDVAMAQIGLAWLLHQEWVNAPIIGTSSVDHLEDAVEALDVDLSRSEREYLTEPYGPVEINGHE